MLVLDTHVWMWWINQTPKRWLDSYKAYDDMDAWEDLPPDADSEDWEW